MVPSLSIIVKIPEASTYFLKIPGVYSNPGYKAAVSVFAFGIASILKAFPK